MEHLKKKINQCSNCLYLFLSEHKIVSGFLAFIAIYVAFDIEILWQPFIWSEDTYFVNHAYLYGIRSLLFRHAAYLEIISRIAGNLAIGVGWLTNSYWNVTFVMRVIAITLGAYYLSYFWIEDFDWVLKGRKKRFFVSFLMLVWICNFYNMMYNVTSLHWMGEVYIFLIGLNMLKDRYPRPWDIVLMILTMLNSPEACIIAAPCVILALIKIKNHQCNKKIFFFAAITSICAITQIILLLTGEEAVNEIITELSPLWHAFFSITELIGFCIEVPVYIFGNQVIFALPNIVLIVIGILIWKKLFQLQKSGTIETSVFIYTAMFLFFHYVLVSYKYPARISQSKDYWEQAAAVCMIFILISSIKIDWVHFIKTKRLGLIILCILLSEFSGIGKIHNPDDDYRAIGEDYYRYDYSILGMDRLEETFDRVDFHSNTYEPVHLYRSWHAYVPVKDK